MCDVYGRGAVTTVWVELGCGEDGDGCGAGRARWTNQSGVIPQTGLGCHEPAPYVMSMCCVEGHSVKPPCPLAPLTVLTTLQDLPWQHYSSKYGNYADPDVVTRCHFAWIIKSTWLVGLDIIFITERVILVCGLRGSLSDSLSSSHRMAGWWIAVFSEERTAGSCNNLEVRRQRCLRGPEGRALLTAHSALTRLPPHVNSLAAVSSSQNMLFY